MPTLKNGQIEYNVKPLPDPKAQLMLQYAQYTTSPTDIYSVIAASPGGMELLGQVSGDLNLSLPAKFQAAGVDDKTIANTALAQIVDSLRTQYPEVYQQALERASIINALK